MLAVLAIAAAATGCVGAKRYRFVHDQPNCFSQPPDPVPGAPAEQTLQYPSVDCRSAFYKAGFIEFDDDGHPIDPAQEKKVLALIDGEKRSAPGGKIITLVYVHGWKNNGHPADPGANPKDVEKFSSALAELGYRARLAAGPGRPAVPVVGVYIGWRGKSLMGPSFFTFVSYWSRRNAANRVGSGADLTSVLNHVIEQTNKDSSTSRVVMVGHSFGARVLEHAVEHGVMLYDEAQMADRKVVTPRVDLVLYVNSANDARLSMARVQALQKQPITVRHPDYDPKVCQSRGTQDPICREYPLLVAITSKGDLDTKYLLPFATSLAPDRKSAPTPPKPEGTFADRTPSPTAYSRAAAGHMPFMHSHLVTEVACPMDHDQPPACSDEDPMCAFAFRSRGDCEACFKASTRSDVDRHPPFNRTPFWIMDVDKRISKDHGDIWNLSLLGMLGELMAPRGFFEPGVARMQVRGQ
jgi:hypothetical protein